MTPPRAPIADLDALPYPNRALIDIARYRNTISFAPARNAITLYATRGCPFRCAFCHGLWPRKTHLRSAENLFEEVRRYRDIGFRRFNVVDDVFNFRPQRGARFFELVIKHGLDIQLFFPNGLRGDILTPEWIDLMAEAGAVQLSLALETSSSRLQRLIGKRLHLDRFEENLTYLTTKHPAVMVDLYTMYGFPSETLEEATATMRFVQSVRWLARPSFHALVIYPNTPMAQLALRHGVSADAIQANLGQEYFKPPATIPFGIDAFQRLRLEFFKTYIMNRERWRHVLWQYAVHLTEEEAAQGLGWAYLHREMTYDEMLRTLGLTRDDVGQAARPSAEAELTPEMVAGIQRVFPGRSAPGGLRILLLDDSTPMEQEGVEFTDFGVEQPLGLISLLTYLNHELGESVDGRIAKASIDYASFDELRDLVAEMRPQVIGMRGMSTTRQQCHQTFAHLREWAPEAILVAGGPYASTSVPEVAPDVDVVVIGEGEVTFTELCRGIVAHGGQLPPPAALAEIPGLAFMAPDHDAVDRPADAPAPRSAS